MEVGGPYHRIELERCSLQRMKPGVKRSPQEHILRLGGDVSSASQWIHAHVLKHREGVEKAQQEQSSQQLATAATAATAAHREELATLEANHQQQRVTAVVKHATQMKIEALRRIAWVLTTVSKGLASAVLHMIRYSAPYLSLFQP